MTIKRISPSLLKITGASDGDFLVFDSANNSVEFRAGSNAWTNANDFATYSTLIAAVNSVQDNVASSDNNTWVNANDFATYTTVTALIDTVQANLTSVISSAPTALDTLAEISAALENDANIAVTLTNSIGTVSSNVDNNTTAINLVQSNLSALPDSAANDYTTYSTLSSLIDTVQDNVSSQSSNTQAYVGGTLLSNTALIVEAGDGISLASNTTSQSITISTSMSNITSQVITVDGSANTFTLVKEVANSNMIFVSYNGLLQDPLLYSISTTSGTSTLTLANTEPLDSGDRIEVRYVDLFQFAGTTSTSSGGGGGGGYTFQGENFGYSSGGHPGIDTIEKFSFTSDASSVDVANLFQARGYGAGISSSTHGYHAGGYATSPAGESDTIDKFLFTSDTDATDVGELPSTGFTITGTSSSTHGYVIESSKMSKFTYASDAPATQYSADGSTSGYKVGVSGSDFGYSLGTNSSPLYEKYPYSSDSPAVSVGTFSRYRIAGAPGSSATAGYVAGGNSPIIGNYASEIAKFPFASDTDTAIGADLSQGRRQTAGQSSTTDGYATGGASPAQSDVIDKYSFSSDVNATDVGELTSTRYLANGQQY